MTIPTTTSAPKLDTVFRDTVSRDTVADEQDEQQDLLRLATSGDASAVAQLLEQYLPRVRAFVRLRMDDALRQRESVSDLVQSVCADLLARQEEFEYRGEEQFRGWLFTAALNKIRSMQRFHGRERRDIRREVVQDSRVTGSDRMSQIYQTLGTPSRALMASEHMAQIEAAFDRLPDDYREVISLARVAGLPHEEVAQHMGRSVGATRQLLGRGIIKLSEALDEVTGC